VSMGQSTSVLAKQQHTAGSSNSGSTVPRALQTLLKDDSDHNYHHLKHACKAKPAHLVDEGQQTTLVAMLQAGDHKVVRQSLKALLILTAKSSPRVHQFAGQQYGLSGDAAVTVNTLTSQEL